MAKKNFFANKSYTPITPDLITIDPELKAFIPALSQEETQQLATSLQNEGCREKLITYLDESGQQVLLDGHNRYSLCTQHNIAYQVRILPDIRTRTEAKLWMLQNQLGRRNTTFIVRCYLRGLRYNMLKGDWGGARDRSQKLGSATDKIEGLANEHKVSVRTIKSDGQLATAIDTVTQGDPLLREQLLQGAWQADRKSITQLAKLDQHQRTLVLKRARQENSLPTAIHEVTQGVAKKTKKKATTSRPAVTRFTEKQRKDAPQKLQKLLAWKDEAKTAEQKNKVNQEFVAFMEALRLSF